MPFLYEHQCEICFLLLGVCALMQSRFVLRGRGRGPAVAVIFTVAVGAIGMGILGPFFSPNHRASAGSLYTALAALAGYMAAATGRLASERRQAES